MRGGALAALLVGAALVLSGCQYLLGPLAGGPVFVPGPGDFGSFDPGEFGSFDPGVFGSFDPSSVPPVATYRTGSATVKMGGSSMTLDQLSAPGSYMEYYGGNAIWTDGAGNYLQVFGGRAGATTLETGGAFLSIERIADSKHLTAADVGSCKVTVRVADKTGFSGSASCKGMHWSDAIAPLDRVGNPVYVGDLPAFDAEITFAAAP